MSTVESAPRTRARTAERHRLTFGHLLRSETIKVLSVRSTWWTLAVAIGLSVGISLLFSAATRDVGAGFAPVNAILIPIQFTMLVAGILGAIVVTGEYSTGMIRSTLTAEPRRGRVLIAKAIVVGLVVAVVTALTFLVAIVVTAPILTTQIDFGDPEASMIPLVLGVVSMVAFALLGLGMGFLIRAGAGAIAATVGILFVLPIVVGLFSIAGESWRWIVDAGRYLPSQAASTLTTPGGAGDDMWPAAIALTAWVVVPLALGWLALRSRDA